jgi:thiamine pyrophosphate-dependent acetolactate synthase large subunit-like protein
LIIRVSQKSLGVEPGLFHLKVPARGDAIVEAAHLINAAKTPVVLVGMLASRPAAANALQSFLTNGRLPVVGTFQAAGAIGPHVQRPTLRAKRSNPSRNKQASKKEWIASLRSQ